MAKKYKIILSVLLVVLVGVAAVVVSGVFDINRRIENGGDAVNDYSLDYNDVYKTDVSVALPLMKTDFENVFFTMSKKGEVKFYEVSGGAITELPENGAYKVEADCSGQKLPAEIHYIERDGSVNGYGLFTNLLYPDVLLYDYAFFKVTDMFDAFADGSDTLLMLLDIDHTRFYSDEKVYSDVFYLYSDKTCKHFLSEEQRVIDIYARQRTDYKMFTDDILAQDDADNVLFFTSRNYVSFEESDKADIFTSGGYGTNVDNIVYIEDVATLDFWRADGKTYYLKETADENGDTAFTVNIFDGSESEIVATFSGDPDEDYIIRDKYILNRLTGDIYNVLTGETKNLSYDKFNSGFAPDLFEISENGRFCAVRGSIGGKVSCGIADLETDRVMVYTDDVFRFIANIQALNDGTIIVSAATGESAAAFYQLTAALA